MQLSTGSVTPEPAEFAVVSPEGVAQKFGWKYDFIRVLQNCRPIILPQLLINALRGQVDLVQFPPGLLGCFLNGPFHHGSPTTLTLRNGFRHFRDAQREPRDAMFTEYSHILDKIPVLQQW